jgi:hypothetical protein
MQETWVLKFESTEAIAQPIDFLKSILETNQKDLGIFLSFYYRKEGAITENVQLLTLPEFSDPFSGKFRVKFDIVHFNACLNIHEQNQGEMALTFLLKPENGELHLKGPFWPEREMDEI